MKFVKRFKHTLHATGVLLAVFALYQFALAQEVTEVPMDTQETVVSEESVPVEESNEGEVLGEQTEEITEEVVVEEQPVVEEEVVVEEIVTETQDEPSFFEKVLDIFSSEDEEIKEENIEEDFFEEEYVEEPFFELPQNLPEISAIPEVKEFETDVDAPHSCWVDTFSVDMQFLPNKNNTVMINNPTTGPSTLEVMGIPPGFDIYFKDNKSQSISVASSQEEVPFVIEKIDETQKGNFNVIFVFTKKMGKNSTTTCQMNLVN